MLHSGSLTLLHYHIQQLSFSILQKLNPLLQLLILLLHSVHLIHVISHSHRSVWQHSSVTFHVVYVLLKF